MNNFSIYTCGGMGKFDKENFNECNEWRLYVKHNLETYCENLEYKVAIINPNDYYNFIQEPPVYDNDREVMEFDLNKVRNSNLVIINFNDMQSLGSMAELAIAYERRIPVIGLNVNCQRLHSWQKEMCNKIFTDIDRMLEYVIDFYLT